MNRGPGDIHKVFVPSQFPIGGTCRVAFLGEAPGYNEANWDPPTPLVGEAGKLYDRWLDHAGLDRAQVYSGNVFSHKPPGNEIGRFFMRKTEAKRTGWDKECPFPPMGSTGYVKEEYVLELGRMRAELEEAQPEIIIGMGRTPLWALTGLDTIGKHRGILMETWWDPPIPVLCTWHPAGVMRAWRNLPQAIADIHKAIRIIDGEFEELKRRIAIEPTLNDIRQFIAQVKHWQRLASLFGQKIALSVDIETEPAYDEMTCIGFAPSATYAFVIPFWDRSKDNWLYWPTLGQHAEAFALVRSILEDPTIPKIFQNGAYDIQWLREYGIKVSGEIHDTMFQAYCMEPELDKSLAVLASLETNSRPWKGMVSFKKKDHHKDDG